MFNSPTKISSIIKPLLYCAMNKLHQDGDWQTISDHFLSVEWFNNIGSHNAVPAHAKMGSRPFIISNACQICRCIRIYMINILFSIIKIKEMICLCSPLKYSFIWLCFLALSIHVTFNVVVAITVINIRQHIWHWRNYCLVSIWNNHQVWNVTDVHM